MRAARFALPVMIGAILLTALARSDTETKRSKTFLGNLAAGDHVTLTTSDINQGYTIALITPEELPRIRQRNADYPARRQQFEADRQKLMEQINAAKPKGPWWLDGRTEAGQKPEAPKPEAPKPEAPKPEAPKPEAARPDDKARSKYDELVRSLQAMAPPPRPVAIKRIVFVGEDYVSVADENYEASVPLHTIREIRRDIATKQAAP